MSTQEFTYNTVLTVSAALRYKLETYIDAYRIFVQTNLPAIQDYYTQNNPTVDTASFDILELLLEESVIIDNLIKVNYSKFITIDQWELISYLEDIKMKLNTCDNLDKWLRSSKTKNSWMASNVITTQYITGMNETLEAIQGQQTGEEDEQDDWVKLALENDLMEMDYDTNGGTVVNVNQPVNQQPNLSLKSVVDNLSGLKLYGLDIAANFGFVDNGNGGDINVLTYQATIIQAISILAQLKKGDAPEFKNLGVDANLSVGNDVSVYYYASVIRQLNDTFATDDTISSFVVTGFYYSNGDLFITYQINTFYGQIYPGNLQLKAS